jgi:hypothetical protein
LPAQKYRGTTLTCQRETTAGRRVFLATLSGPGSVPVPPSHETSQTELSSQGQTPEGQGGTAVELTEMYTLLKSPLIMAQDQINGIGSATKTVIDGQLRGHAFLYKIIVLIYFFW